MECGTQDQATRNYEAEVARLKRRLKELGRGDEVLSEIMDTLASIHLAQAPPDPERPILTEEQLRYRSRQNPELRESDTDTEAEALMQRIEDAAELEALLKDLPREERLTFAMTYGQMPQKLIAAAMSCSVPTVKRRLNEARGRLARRRALLDQVLGPAKM